MKILKIVGLALVGVLVGAWAGWQFGGISGN
jgi:hypothetical protein